jgi:AcrR family transcriptional regulator
VSDVTAERPGRAGRPRNQATDRAIFDATLDLLAEVGYAGVTIDEVARRANVGRPTVYRRWPNKKAMVVAVFVDQWAPVPATPAGDPLALLHQLIPVAVHELIGSRIGPAVMLEMFAVAATDRDIAETLNAETFDPRRQMGLDLIQRGIDAGDLRSDTDPALVLDKMLAPSVYRWMILGAPPVPDKDLHDIIDQAWDAARR